MYVIRDLASGLAEHGSPIIGQMDANWLLLLPHPQPIACICLYLGWMSGLTLSGATVGKQPVHFAFRTTPDIICEVLVLAVLYRSPPGYPHISLETAHINSAS